MSGTETKWTPQKVSDVKMAFPFRVSHLMPSWDEIPDEFKRFRGTKWNEAQSEWFFKGIDKRRFIAKDGIDKNAALRHLKCIQGSFEPQHEHKEAAVAYLMSLWFDDVRGVE